MNKRGQKELSLTEENRDHQIFGNELGRNCKIRFLLPHDNKEDLAFGILVKENMYKEMRRKSGIHPIPKETVLE